VRQVLERGDERELDALALLVVRIRAGGRGVEAQSPVWIGLDPDRFDDGLAGAVVRIGGRAIVDGKHQLWPALDSPQAYVRRDGVEP
jgi:hypothetical protein